MPTNNFQFKIIDKYCNEFSIIQKFFTDTIQPLYGDQSSALEKIGRSEDRVCEALFLTNNPKGLSFIKKIPLKAV